MSGGAAAAITANVPATGEAPSPLPSASPLDRTFLTNQPDVTTLILIRHGKQFFAVGSNPTPVDWVDPPLSGTGERQAEAVGRSLAGEHIDAVYCSPLARAQVTAQSVARHHGLTPTSEPGLREVEVFRDVPPGVAITDVLTAGQIEEMQDRFIQERRWDVYPYSESSAEFRPRVVAAIEAIVAAHPGQRVVVACHSGVINAYVGHVLGLPHDMTFRPAHASVTRVLAGGDRRVVHSLNETHHLVAADPELLTV
jgi:probable phosphoglycerate mutase